LPSRRPEDDSIVGRLREIELRDRGRGEVAA
jgi:hypothetical protein